MVLLITEKIEKKKDFYMHKVSVKKRNHTSGTVWITWRA